MEAAAMHFTAAKPIYGQLNEIHTSERCMNWETLI